MPHIEHYYVEPEHVREDRLTLVDEEAHHLHRVKRHKSGDIIWTVDGHGSAYEVILTDISRNRAEGKIIQTRRRLGEPIAEITLAQGLIKGERFDWIIEKSVEIGMHRIIPMITETTIVKESGSRQNRWKRIALNAMKQCGRSNLPEITEPRLFKHVCALGADCQFRFIAHASPESQPFEIIRPHDHRPLKAICMIGPEGGFTDDEINMARDNGFTPVSLGPRRLRAETAGIVLSAIILSQWGELC